MTCGPQCSDCPTCRGEVESTAPVMHDLRFALETAKGPWGQDPFFGPLRVAQMVRTAVEQRAGSGPGDAKVLNLVEQVAQSVVNRAAPWSLIGVRGALGQVPMPLSSASDQFQSQPQSASVVGMGSQTVLFFPRGGAGPVPPPQGSDGPVIPGPVWLPTQEVIDKIPFIRPGPVQPPAGSGGRGNCCPVLNYPSLLDPPAYTDPGEASTGFKSARVTRFFKWDATYKKPTEQPGCYCECCEFVHLIVLSVFTFTPIDPNSQETAENAKKALPPEEGNVYNPREDNCTFVVKEDGVWKQRKERRSWKPPDPKAQKGVTWDGPYCYGDRDRPRDVPPGCPKELTPPITRPDACHIVGNDRPGRSVPFGHTYTWLWMSIGIVFDTCLSTIAASKYVWWSIKGTVPWPPAKPSFDDGPGGHDYQAKGEVEFPKGM